MQNPSRSCNHIYSDGDDYVDSEDEDDNNGVYVCTKERLMEEGKIRLNGNNRKKLRKGGNGERKRGF